MTWIKKSKYEELRILLSTQIRDDQDRRVAAQAFDQNVAEALAEIVPGLREKYTHHVKETTSHHRIAYSYTEYTIPAHDIFSGTELLKDLIELAKLQEKESRLSGLRKAFGLEGGK